MDGLGNDPDWVAMIFAMRRVACNLRITEATARKVVIGALMGGSIRAEAEEMYFDHDIDAVTGSTGLPTAIPQSFWQKGHAGDFTTGTLPPSTDYARWGISGDPSQNSFARYAPVIGDPDRKQFALRVKVRAADLTLLRQSHAAILNKRNPRARGNPTNAGAMKVAGKAIAAALLRPAIEQCELSLYCGNLGSGLMEKLLMEYDQGEADERAVQRLAKQIVHELKILTDPNEPPPSD